MSKAAKPPARGAPDLHVALLRGINVGGKNKLAMADLAALFVDAGCTDVRTYIQSGNVVFRAKPVLAQRVPAVIAKAIATRFGLKVPVVTRTADELRAAAKCNPYLRAGADTRALHIAFLREQPTADQGAALDPKRSPPDEFRLVGREIYLHCPNGVADSKLTNAYFDSKLATISTVRNWNTVNRLLELLAG